MPKRKDLPTAPSPDITTNRAFVYWQGKKTYFGKWGSTLAAKRFKRWLADAIEKQAVVTITDDPALNQCFAKFLDHASEFYGPESGEFRNLKGTVIAVMRNGFGHDKAREFGTKKLSALQSAMAMEKKKDADRLRYSRTTVNAHVHRFRRIMRWLVTEEIIPADIVKALEMVPGLSKGRTTAREPMPVRPVPIDVVVKTLEFTSPTVKAMARLQTAGGMRPAEICRMTPAMIDRSQTVWMYRPAKHKTTHRGKTLVKAIPPIAQLILEPFLTGCPPDEPVFSPSDSLRYWRQLERKPSTKVATARKRTFYTSGTYGKSIVYAIRRAAKQQPPVTIPHWAPNQLRHLAGTEARTQLGVEAASLLLGHSKPDVTLIYAEASELRLAEIAGALHLPFEKTIEERRRTK